MKLQFLECKHNDNAHHPTAHHVRAYRLIALLCSQEMTSAPAIVEGAMGEPMEATVVGVETSMGSVGSTMTGDQPTDKGVHYIFCCAVTILL